MVVAVLGKQGATLPEDMMVTILEGAKSCRLPTLP